jgi:hypothetical protein
VDEVVVWLVEVDDEVLLEELVEEVTSWWRSFSPPPCGW